MKDYSENFSHRVRATEVEIHSTDRPQAEIHKAGCKHRAYSVKPLDLKGVMADDYFYVAPCAR